MCVACCTITLVTLNLLVCFLVTYLYATTQTWITTSQWLHVSVPQTFIDCSCDYCNVHSNWHFPEWFLQPNGFSSWLSSITLFECLCLRCDYSCVTLCELTKSRVGDFEVIPSMLYVCWRLGGGGGSRSHLDHKGQSLNDASRSICNLESSSQVFSGGDQRSN